jgi:hypothetical protein
LLIMAAGMGSRYGGLKQIDPVGPAGETIMEYSVFDALRAGFGRLVCVIRRDIEAPFKEKLGSRFSDRIPITYVYQELEDLPEGFTVPPGRKKPWGSGQAILAAADAIDEPFAAINADDFYGATSFRVLANHLTSGSPDYAMVGFVLGNTLSEFGTVARGVCHVGADGYLTGVTEMKNIAKEPVGASHTDEQGRQHRLTGLETVSMSMWGFLPSLFPQLRAQFVEFLKQHGGEATSEFYIPAAVNGLVSTGAARCRVLASPDSWFGVTYQEDRPAVVQRIQQLVASGAYPPALWG